MQHRRNKLSRDRRRLRRLASGASRYTQARAQRVLADIATRCVWIEDQLVRKDPSGLYAKISMTWDPKPRWEICDGSEGT